MSEQEQADFQKSVELARAALKAATAREEAARTARARAERGDEDSLHHLRFR